MEVCGGFIEKLFAFVKNLDEVKKHEVRTERVFRGEKATGLMAFVMHN